MSEVSPPGSMVRLTFEAFDIEDHEDCEWDWVEVSYGSFSEKFCGNSIPGPFVSESPITVKIHTDGSVTESGFRATWTTENTNSTTTTNTPTTGCRCGVERTGGGGSQNRIAGGTEITPVSSC